MATRPKTSQPADQLDFDRVVPIFFLVLVDVLGLTLVLPLLHLYAIRFGATPIQIGLVAASFPAAQLIGVPLMGALSDRYGRKPLLLISQLSTFVGFIVLALSNSLELVILSRVIDGLFGANLATAQAALSDISTDETRAQGLGITGAAFGLGFIFGPATALIMFEFTNDLSMPAWTAAAYSMLSILLTLFRFKETLPRERRGTQSTGRRQMPGLFTIFRYLTSPVIGVLLFLMFAQQVVFYGFESLLGTFTLSRLGLLAQGNSFIFILVGVILVWVQVRGIRQWSRKYGEARLVHVALALLGIGLVLLAMTPEQPFPLYDRNEALRSLLVRQPGAAEALVGTYTITLPPNRNFGVGGVLWAMMAMIPLSIGAGLIRPSLNSLLTKHVRRQEFGSILGTSAAFVSAADAVAPLAVGIIFQRLGLGAPYLLGGAAMLLLFLVSLLAVHRPGATDDPGGPGPLEARETAAPPA
jgi:MFS family permease